jgi:fibronectin type 3 domain-containing protein
LEGAYDGGNAQFGPRTDAAGIRDSTYQTFLSGSGGDMYGNGTIWYFSSGWQQQMTGGGGQAMVNLAALKNSVAWYNMVPDQNGTVFQGVRTSQTDYVGAFAPDGTLAIAYKPNTGTSSQSFTVNMSKFGGPVTAEWFDPTNGAYTPIGANLANSGTMTFSSPSTNSAGKNDFVLVLKATPVSAQAPSVTTQPASQTVKAGQSVTFSVTATGTAPLGYQWQHLVGSTWTNVGSNSASYSISSAASSDAGSYRVTVSNSAGSVTSNTVTLTVNVAPTITTQPNSQTVTAGQSATFSVTAVGTAPLSYQWQKLVNGTWTNISGATSASFTISSAQASDAGSYWVVVSNSAGSATSNSVSLTVNPVATGFSAHINFTGNFQSGSTPTTPDTVPGYINDIGKAYGSNGGGLTFGWNVDNTANGRDRQNPSSPDELHDSLIHMNLNGTFTWSIAVPNGTYSVHVVTGDPSNTDVISMLTVNGVLTVSSSISSTNHWLQGTVTITVTNGVIALAEQAGAYDKIDYIDITQTSSTQPPAAPTNLAATAGNAKVLLNWSASSGATSYNIYRGTAAGGESSTAIATGVSGTSYTNTSLTNGTTYYYKVAAVNAGGTSPLSGEASATPAATETMGANTVLPLADSGNGNLLTAQQATLAQAGTLQSLSFYVTQAAGSLILGVYDASGPSGGPGKLLAQTSSFTPVVGWNTAAVTTSVQLAAGTYWLAYLPSDNNLAFVKTTTSPVNSEWYSFSFGPLPAQFSTSFLTSSSHWSLYATLGLPELLAGTPIANSHAPALTQQQLDRVVAEAIRLWAGTGLNADQLSALRHTQFVITTLPAGVLGETFGNTIYIDANADGYGWSLGAVVSPHKVDLLTVVSHELGHELGLPDLDTQANPGNVMDDTLAPGVRRLP